MIYRFTILVSLFLMLICVPASGVNIYTLPDGFLTAAASKMVEKDFQGAIESAVMAPDSGMRDFMLGMALTRLGEWEKSAEYLGKASERFPLLADYAVYNHASALSRLNRYPEALTIIQLFIRNFPDSPLGRPAKKLQADILFETGNFPGASDAYEKYIGEYPSGTNSLEAMYRVAICREKMGDISSAVNTLRNLWLNYPASAIADKTESDLKRLAEEGNVAAPYSAEELMRRGAVLYELGKYDKAIKAFTAIPLEKQNDDFYCRLTLKTGKARFKARKFKEAEQTFISLLAKKPGQEFADEAMFWLAKTLDKSRREDDAFAAYEMLAETSPDSPLADDALLAASFIRKFQNEGNGALIVLKKLVTGYPQSNLLQTANWEIAWQSYQGGDLKTAAVYFKKLLDINDKRERALYWYARTLAAGGDKKGAEKAIAALLAEYPLGYYSFSYTSDSKLPGEDALPNNKDLREFLPVPAGFERAKVMIALGLHEEAAKEISWSRKRDNDIAAALPGIARLYLEMGNFNRASYLVKPASMRKIERNSLVKWGIAYPLAFRELVVGNAAESNIAESIVYSIMRAESNYSPSAKSPAGAVGLLQIMPATAAAFVTSGSEKEISGRLTRPDFNIRLGVKHLKGLLELHEGDIVMAVAAYNAGSGNVNRWKRMFGKLPKDQFIENIPFPETREYVKKVLAGIEIYKRLYKFGASKGPINHKSVTPVKDVPRVQPPPLPKKVSPAEDIVS
jgi:soluble lytic murein transglycosylase